MSLHNVEQWKQLDELPVSGMHRERLKWFLEFEGRIVPYSTIASLQNPGLTSLPKGIYKPRGWDYVLSVKETLGSPYGDIPIATLANGDWVYRYHREDGDNKFTNAGLLNCMRDQIPVGVLIQVEQKPRTRYFVAGLGRLTNYADPWFDLVNWRSVETEASLSKSVAETSVSYDLGIGQEALPGFFEDTLADRFSPQLVRPNQQMFRVMMLSTYDRTCAVTESRVAQALEAAHIVPYAYKRMDSVHNGLLLRADVHRLFDRGLIGVNTDHMETVVSPRLIGTEYEDYSDKPLSLPADSDLHPSLSYLDDHRKSWNLH